MKLKAWNLNRQGSSGRWLIHALPGMAVVRHGKRWQIAIIEPDPFLDAITGGSTRKAWGRDFSTQRAEDIIEQNRSLQTYFKTRGEALSALEAIINPGQPEPVLKDVLYET